MPMVKVEKHQNVAEYDGAFVCHDCGGSWGALPGTPEMPKDCIIPKKLYDKNRDPEMWEPFYSRHVLAMTDEDLRAKCDIAAELAYRDKQINILKYQLDVLKGDNYDRSNDNELVRSRTND